jgi:hypothetical protein
VWSSCVVRDAWSTAASQTSRSGFMMRWKCSPEDLDVTHTLRNPVLYSAADKIEIPGISFLFVQFVRFII